MSTITFTTDAATDTRLQAWATTYLGLATTATLAQVKQAVIQVITQQVQQKELPAAINAIVPTPISQLV